jgi:hypothetical protein
VLFLALVVAGHYWSSGFETLWECMITQWDGLTALARYLIRVAR